MTTVLGLLQDGEERVRANDSLGINAPEDLLKMKPDAMMVDLITIDLNHMESRMPKQRKAKSEQTMLKGHNWLREDHNFGDRICSRYKI